jgi:hypothetical protein
MPVGMVGQVQAAALRGDDCETQSLSRLVVHSIEGSRTAARAVRQQQIQATGKVVGCIQRMRFLRDAKAKAPRSNMSKQSAA